MRERPVGKDDTRTTRQEVREGVYVTPRGFGVETQTETSQGGPTQGSGREVRVEGWRTSLQTSVAFRPRDSRPSWRWDTTTRLGNGTRSDRGDVLRASFSTGGPWEGGDWSQTPLKRIPPEFGNYFWEWSTFPICKGSWFDPSPPSSRLLRTVKKPGTPSMNLKITTTSFLRRTSEDPGTLGPTEGIPSIPPFRQHSSSSSFRLSPKSRSLEEVLLRVGCGRRPPPRPGMLILELLEVSRVCRGTLVGLSRK